MFNNKDNFVGVKCFFCLFCNLQNLVFKRETTRSVEGFFLIVLSPLSSLDISNSFAQVCVHFCTRKMRKQDLWSLLLLLLMIFFPHKVGPVWKAA